MELHSVFHSLLYEGEIVTGRENGDQYCLLHSDDASTFWVYESSNEELSHRMTGSGVICTLWSVLRVDHRISQDIRILPGQTDRRSGGGQAPDAGLTSLPGFIKRIAQRCKSPHYVQCLYGAQDVVHEILHEAQGNDERKHHVKWRDTIVLRKHLAIFEKEGYRTESHRPS